MSEEVKSKVKALFPENVEGIYISKNDYDRLYGDLTLKNIELKQEIERLKQRIDKAIEYIEKKTKNNQTYIYTEDIEKAIKMLKGEYKE